MAARGGDGRWEDKGLQGEKCQLERSRDVLKTRGGRSFQLLGGAVKG